MAPNNSDTVAAARDVVKWLDQEGMLDRTPVILIGSAARDMRRRDSDIDILVIGNERLARRPRFAYDIHVIAMSPEDFLRRARARDDLPLWALCYGKVLSDKTGWFARMRKKKESLGWPDWRPKRDLGLRRIQVSLDALEHGDVAAAREELTYALSHLARASLLRHRILPGVRPELASQLRRAGCRDLADWLDLLISDSVVDEHTIRAIALSSRSAELPAPASS